MRHLACAILTGMFFLVPPARTEAVVVSLTDEQATEIGRRVWKNECSGTVEGLTSWNHGEDFASLGIGHFIWYPAGKVGPFQESFPAMIQYLGEHTTLVPKWLKPKAPPCPWNTREEFLQDFQGKTMKQLRAFLAGTVHLQARFLVARLVASLPRMLLVAAPQDRKRVEAHFYQVAHLEEGPYALIDYVNFKGEGILETERYKGEGWGLLQVLSTMQDLPPEEALGAFSQAARAVLTRRVKNSPPQRHESRWLPGWLKRVDGYAR